jgi:mono/diheme cytochrome c family protein
MKWVFGRTAVWVVLTIMTAAIGFAAVQNSNLPDGDGKKILETACTACHGLDALDKFKGTYKSNQWRDLVVNMKAYGAAVDDAQVTTLVDYLTKNFGPKDSAAGGASNDAAGKQILETACSTCHGADAVQSLHLDKTAWTDLVRNMIGNGAAVTDEQIPVLVDYLVNHYGPQKE